MSLIAYRSWLRATRWSVWSCAGIRAALSLFLCSFLLPLSALTSTASSSHRSVLCLENTELFWTLLSLRCPQRCNVVGGLVLCSALSFSRSCLEFEISSVLSRSFHFPVSLRTCAAQDNSVFGATCCLSSGLLGEKSRYKFNSFVDTVVGNGVS